MIINVVCCFKETCLYMCVYEWAASSKSVPTLTAPQDCFSSRLLCAFNFCVWAAQYYRRVTSLLLLRGIDVIAEMSAWTTCVFITAWAKDHKIKLLLFFYVYAWKKDTVLLNLHLWNLLGLSTYHQFTSQKIKCLYWCYKATTNQK